MSGSLNKVCLLGNVGADPEVRSFQNGNKVCNIRLATSESWKDRNSGERKERTEWHTVAIFSEGLVGVAERFVQKGSKIYVEGQLRTRKWQDQSGNDRYATEVVLQGFDAKLILLGEKGSGSGSGGHQQRSQSGGTSSGWGSGGAASGAQGQRTNRFEEDLDDDIPF